MENSTNNTNNANGNEMNAAANFLGTGSYDIVSVTKRNGERGVEFIAEVRRLNNAKWNNETVNLSYLFSANSVGPMLKYQPETLIEHVINVQCTQNVSKSGKVFFTYVWGINIKLTKIVQAEIDESVNMVNADEYDRQQRIDQEEQDWINEQYYQEELEYQQDMEILNMHDAENTDTEDKEEE